MPRLSKTNVYWPFWSKGDQQERGTLRVFIPCRCFSRPCRPGLPSSQGGRVCGMHGVGTKEKALTARLRKGLKNLVAGAGFEPTTFGL